MWDEKKHRRNKIGQFTSGNGGSAPTKEEAEKMPAGELKKMLAIPLSFFSESGLKNKSSLELNRGIKTLKKRLLEHEQKIASPEKFCKDWELKSDAQRKGLLNFWGKECKNLSNGINERIEILKERGEYDE